MSGPSRWISSTETGLLAQAGKLAANAEALQAALNLSTAQIAALTAASEAFAATYDAKISSEEAYRASVLANNAARASLVEEMSAINKWVQAQPTVTDETKAEAGFPVYAIPSRGAPITPGDLTAEVFGQAGVFLKWKRTGNPKSARFMVQQKVGTGGWTAVETTNGTRLRFQVAAPGTPTQFRVIASRGEEVSAPSIAVSLWAGEEESVITLAA